MKTTTIYVIVSRCSADDVKDVYKAFSDRADAERFCEILADDNSNFSYSVEEITLFL